MMSSSRRRDRQIEIADARRDHCKKIESAKMLDRLPGSPVINLDYASDDVIWTDVAR
jgi:hypothetical protein